MEPTVVEERDERDEMLDLAWGLIANAGGGRGDWGLESPEWVAAAERWRDRYVTPTMHDPPVAPDTSGDDPVTASVRRLPSESMRAGYRVDRTFVPTHVGLTDHGPELGGVLRVRGDLPTDQFVEFRRKWEQEHGLARPVVLDVEEPRDVRQRTVSRWCAACFGRDEATSVPQRGMRLVEEAIEAAQAAGVPRDKVLQMVDHVYGREPGELHQELGGVGVTLLALAEAAQLSADECEARELERVLSKPTSYYAERNAAKNAAGFRVVVAPDWPLHACDNCGATFDLNETSARHHLSPRGSGIKSGLLCPKCGQESDAIKNGEIPK